MSEFDRRTGVKKLVVRGMAAVGFHARRKAIGLNILHAGAVGRTRVRAHRAYGLPIGLADTVLLAIKEQMKHLAENLEPSFLNPIQAADRYHHLVV
jgi:hypothetical protein